MPVANIIWLRHISKSQKRNNPKSESDNFDSVYGSFTQWGKIHNRGHRLCFLPGQLCTLISWLSDLSKWCFQKWHTVNMWTWPVSCYWQISYVMWGKKVYGTGGTKRHPLITRNCSLKCSYNATLAFPTLSATYYHFHAMANTDYCVKLM